jgi:hypothetical protein
MWEIFEQICSKLDGYYESYLYLGLVRPISDGYHFNTLVHFGNIYL